MGRMAAGASLYDRLGVPPEANASTLRAAYRRRARELHPDVLGAGADPTAMAELNEAWRVLSDPDRRRAYDATLGRAEAAAARSTGAPRANPAPTFTTRRPAPPPPRTSSPGWRREAWLAGLQLQIRRLGTLAARSAVQTLAVRHPGVPRSDYEALVEPVVAHLLLDTGERIRVAREAGAAPLDLAIGAALLGLGSYAGRLEAEARRTGPLPHLVRSAEMVDRMWDTMAHEIPRPLEHALGDNPRAVRRVR